MFKKEIIFLSLLKFMHVRNSPHDRMVALFFGLLPNYCNSCVPLCVILDTSYDQLFNANISIEYSCVVSVSLNVKSV